MDKVRVKFPILLCFSRVYIGWTRGRHCQFHRNVGPFLLLTLDSIADFFNLKAFRDDKMTVTKKMTLFMEAPLSGSFKMCAKDVGVHQIRDLGYLVSNTTSI